jgi:hypothetical protein
VPEGGREGREVVEENDAVVAVEMRCGSCQQVPAEADTDSDDGAWSAVVRKRAQRDRRWFFPVGHEGATVDPKQLALTWPFPNQDVESALESAGADREVELLLGSSSGF